MRSSWQSVVEDLRARWIPAGLDLAQPFQVAWYNCAVADACRLPDFGRSSALGIRVGKTRAIWPRFLDAWRENRPGLDERHPLESYVEATVLPALEPPSHRSEVRWAQDPPPRRVAMQRLARISGLAYLSQSHLSVHATYGPRIALRVAVEIDIEGPSGPPPEPPNPLSPVPIARAAEVPGGDRHVRSDTARSHRDRAALAVLAGQHPPLGPDLVR